MTHRVKNLSGHLVGAKDRVHIKESEMGADTAGKSFDLPEMNESARFGETEQAAYRKFKEARSKNVMNYMGLEGEFSKFLDDPYTVVEPRESVNDDVEILIIGGGFGALLNKARLETSGFKNVRICEKAGDVGGTWYWNRYPGVACDVESYSYFPLLDETGYIPTMKFASGFEIFKYCKLLAQRFGVYEPGAALFHTTVTETAWDESQKRWRVKTDRGDNMTAKFVIMANGILTTPKLAKIKGMQSFQGRSFHTSRWDYGVDLKGLRVGIIGTGATAVQAVPELAKEAKELFVFQRTPSSIDIRNQKRTDLALVKEWKKKPQYFTDRRNRHAQITSGRYALLSDGLDKPSVKKPRKVRDPNSLPLSQEQITAKMLDANYRIMEQIRARVDEEVDDPQTAALLKPYYPYGCKRPVRSLDVSLHSIAVILSTVLISAHVLLQCFHDEYLAAFNLPHVHLVDCAEEGGVQLINEKGPVVQGQQYELDVLIYATGFVWMGTGSFNNITGRDGSTLAEKWAPEGTKTFLGLHSHGFPNMFIMSGPQGGGGSFNFTTAADEHGHYLQWLLDHMRTHKLDVVDVQQQAEDEYVQHCYDADKASAPLRDCITYYNGEGTARPGSLAYYGGREWAKRVAQAQDTLAPYIFQ
jgi:cyclohexanone monooxygenase